MATKKPEDSLRSFLIEIAIYAVLVVGYLFLVMSFLNRPLKTLFDNHKPVYAVLALLIIVIQGVILESLTTLLVKLIAPRAK
jgi:hypothetical protein